MTKSDLLRDPSSWQAVSHPELAARKPEVLFTPEFSERYRGLHRLLWKRFVRLHGTLQTLEEIEQFPFHAIYPPGEKSFWDLVIENFRDMFCIMLHSLVKDGGSEAHTLLRFKNEIRKADWRDKKLLMLFDESLDKCRFNDRTESIASRMTDIRNNRVAHQLVDHSKGSLRGVMQGVTLEEQRELFGAAHSLFGTLSFGAAYMTLPGDLMPSTIGGQLKRSCLTNVLDAVLKDSFIVNQPEQRKEWWLTDRQYMKPEDLDLMNQLRVRVGKPPA